MQITKEFSEFIGILLGDGFLWKKDNHYRIGITVSSKNKQYQKHILKLITTFHQGFVRIVKRNRAVYLLIHSKKLFNILTKELSIPFGSKKGTEGVIPKEIIKAGFLNYCLKGLFDTDGTFFRSKKGNNPAYPTIEFTNTNVPLLKQINIILRNKGFKTHLREYKGTKKRAFKISIYGEKMLCKWFKLISISNQKHKSRINSFHNSNSFK